MRIIDKLSYSHNWNIGFCDQTSVEFVQSKSIKKIQWMKHSYRDRWFADPFILSVSRDEIVVFVEECLIEHPKGILCELIIDRATKQLKQRYVILELDTHLSYPAIIRQNGHIYVYPENGESGRLYLYEYDQNNHKLINPICLLNKAMADSTIVKIKGKYYLIATLFPNTQEKAFVFTSEELFGPYTMISEKPFQTSREYSRPAGNWLLLDDNVLYRPAQDCSIRYGSSISMMHVDISGSIIHEKCDFKILPMSRKYSHGIHTVNFLDGLCVVDGYGFKYPIAGAIISFLRSLKYLFFK